MANNHKDDGSFDDTDFEDLDPIEDDDLGDESPAGESFADDAWDDEESEMVSDDDVAHAVDEDVAPENSIGSPKKRTFVQKNFGLIAASVVVAFGGIAALSLMGGNSTPRIAETADALPVPDTAAFDANTPADLAEAETMPPMPAPINPGENAEAEPDGALTPMPMPGQNEDTELAALEIEEVPAAPAGKTSPQGEKPFDFPAQEPDPALADDGTSDAAALENVPSLPPATEEEPQERNPAEKAADYANAQFRARAGLSTEKVSNDNAQASLQEQAKEEQPPAPDLTPQLEAQKSEIAALQKKLEAQQEKAEKSANDLKSSLEQKNDEIASLQKSLKVLEKELSAARAAAEKAAATAKAAEKNTAAPLVESKQPEPEQEIAIEDAPEDIKPAEPLSSSASKQADMAKAPAKDLIPEKKPVSVRAASWELKGASPGKAVLSSKTTGDTRNVAVGDTIQGLGKITAIARENGRWTVRGTQGVVTR